MPGDRDGEADECRGPTDDHDRRAGGLDHVDDLDVTRIGDERAGVGLTVASVTSRTLAVGEDARAIPLDPPRVPALGLVTRRGLLTPAAAAFRDLAAVFLLDAGTP